MACLFCRRKIGPLRRFADANFCCTDHRNKYRANSARALREAEDLYGAEDETDERWRVYSSKSEPEKPSPATGSQSSAFVVALAVAFLLFAITRGSNDGPAPAPSSRASKGSTYANAANGLQRKIGEAIENRAPVTLRETFATGLVKWDTPPGLKASDWAFNNGYVRPGRLRVWKDSESLANYDMEFVGHVEKKSMDWAFRAADFKNYYATKLTVNTKSTSLANTGLVRFAMIDGKERDRVEVPLPITLERNTDYNVKVSVRGARFLTSINGQLVSSWTDNRISRGGVGLFADLGESSAFKWLSVSERDSFWGRLASHFSIIVFPSLPQQASFTR